MPYTHDTWVLLKKKIKRLFIITEILELFWWLDALTHEYNFLYPYSIIIFVHFYFCLCSPSFETNCSTKWIVSIIVPRPFLMSYSFCGLDRSALILYSQNLYLSFKKRHKTKSKFKIYYFMYHLYDIILCTLSIHIQIRAR